MTLRAVLENGPIDSVGERVRAARLDAALTQRELARGIMSTSQLSLVERDHRRPSSHVLALLAERLCIPVFTLAPNDAVVGRERRECRLEQARRALDAGNLALAERLATMALASGSNGDRRMHAYVVRAEVREAMHLARAAFDDLGLALDIARSRLTTRDFVGIALSRERLRHQLLDDDAA